MKWHLLPYEGYDFSSRTAPFHMLTTPLPLCFSSLGKPCSTNIILATAAISNKKAASFIFAEFEQLQPDQLFLCCMKTQK